MSFVWRMLFLLEKWGEGGIERSILTQCKECTTRGIQLLFYKCVSYFRHRPHSVVLTCAYCRCNLLLKDTVWSNSEKVAYCMSSTTVNINQEVYCA
jgi:hypothetical protein